MAEDNLENEFDYLSTVKIFLGVTDSSSDNILQVYIKLTEKSICNYCNIDELPSALDYTLCQMVADTYRENNALNSNGSVVGNISSISEDGRSVGFGGVESIKASIENRILRTTELKHYRKLFRV